MSNKSSIFPLFSVLVFVMLFGIWSNIYVYAQQSSSPTLSPPAPGSSLSKPISSELKAIMCDPSNPSLKVVNTTEARICGIPKTVKPPMASAATPQTTPVVSSSPTEQTVTTKLTTAAATAHPKQQQITTTNNNTNAISRPTVGASGATVSPVSQPTSKSHAGIAPQVKAVNQQPLPSIRGINTTAPQVKAVNGQQRPLAAPIPITLINSTAGLNSTAGQNYTFAATSRAVTSDQVLYLGYHGTSNPTHGNGGSKHDDSRDSKSSTHSSTRSVSSSSSKDKDTKPTIPHIKIITTDNDSKAKKKTISTKSDRTDTTNAESSLKDKSRPNTESSSDHGVDSGSTWKQRTKSDDHANSKHSDSTDTTPSSHKSTDHSSSKDKGKSDPKPHRARTTSNDDSSDATSFSHKEDSGKSSSNIENDISSVIVKSFNPKHSTDSDSSDEGGDSFFDGDKFFSDEDDDGF